MLAISPLHSTLDRRDLNFRLTGIFPLLFFIFQTLHYWRLNNPAELGNMLWPCNIGNLILAIGILAYRPPLIRVATLWMIPGLVVWFIYVVLTWGVFLTSTLAHVGGVTVALFAVYRVGMDKTTWLYAFGGYLLLQLLAFLFTAPALNVNLAHSVYEGWQGTFNAYWKFWLATTVVSAFILFALGMVLWKVWPARVEEVKLVGAAESV
jgi:hypothetical protein